MVGTPFGRYLIENEIGRGGMGVVYRARDIKLDRLVAIKVLDQSLRSNPDAWGLILNEAQIASALNHPCICTIYDAGEEDEQPYIAMEYVEGCPLNILLMPSGLDSTLLAHTIRQIASALAHAHERGTIHRDLKSSNIVVTNQGGLKILDFGLAKRTRPELTGASSSSNSSFRGLGGLVGTIHYLAPEVLRGKRANVRSDIWSLGVLLYEMATGTLPFLGKTVFELATAIMTSDSEPPPKKIPVWTTHVIAKCLERDLTRRYPCVRDVVKDLPIEVASDPALDLAMARMHTRSAQAAA
jgi:serine/threonine protein kinase